MTDTDEILTQLGIKPGTELPFLRERINILLRRGCTNRYVCELMREQLRLPDERG